MIDPNDFEQGMRLTAIAFGTAFGLLVFLMLVIMTLGFSVRRVLRRKSSPSDEPGPDARGRALAAVVGVNALLDQGDPVADAGNATLPPAAPG